MSWARSGRARGSPPVRSSCITPAVAASLKTRDQVPAGSSSLRPVSSRGLEQYTQCRGQRWVSSAMRARGPFIGLSYSGEPRQGKSRQKILELEQALPPCPAGFDQVQENISISNTLDVPRLSQTEARHYQNVA